MAQGQCHIIKLLSFYHKTGSNEETQPRYGLVQPNIKVMDITKEPNQIYKYLSTLETYKLPECDWEMQPHVEIADLKMQQWTAERGNITP